MKELVEKAFEESWLNDFYHGNYKGHARVGFFAGIKWADTHPKSPWISVEDSYPPFESKTEKTRFLVRVISGSAEPKIIYTIAYLLRYDKFNVEMDWVSVTHWMPIPYME